jgi:hypothetical protein
LYFYSIWYRHSVSGRAVHRLRADSVEVFNMIYIYIYIYIYYRIKELCIKLVIKTSLGDSCSRMSFQKLCIILSWELYLIFDIYMCFSIH